MEIEKFMNLDEWKSGPKFLFLKNLTDQWQLLEDSPRDTNAAEIYISSLSNISPTEKFLQSVSSWNKLKRLTAWILRLKKKLRHEQTETGTLKISDINAAENHIIKYVQQKYYLNTISSLIKDRSLTRKDTLKKLNPYLDEEGILRVGIYLRFTSEL